MKSQNMRTLLMFIKHYSVEIRNAVQDISKVTSSLEDVSKTISGRTISVRVSQHGQPKKSHMDDLAHGQPKKSHLDDLAVDHARSDPSPNQKSVVEGIDDSDRKGGSDLKHAQR